MKNITPAFSISFILCLLLAGCSASESMPEKNENTTQIEVIDNTAISETAITDYLPEETPDETSGNTEQIPEPAEISDSASEEAGTQTTADSKTKAIVWLGDSLTQGSLGDDNDNLANAPYEKLKNMVNVPVEGYGLYGYNTHDIFWVYLDEDHFNQEVDPQKTYVFWVGSNDWVVDGIPNSETSGVINEIDSFLNRGGGISNYIVLGTTSRINLGDLYIPINKELKSHYGQHYMDVIDIINKYGYTPDNTHLSQESYDAIAAAVYEKLKSLGYI